MNARGSKGRPGGWSDARRRALSAWRGVDLTSQEQSRRITARGAADVMSRALKEINLEQKRADVEILSVWKDLMDPEVVEHAKPANLHKGTLFVDVDSSVWLDEIVRYRQRDILRNLQNSFGRQKIRKISFRIG